MKELEDLDWFPEELRKQQTDFIGFVVSSFGIYDPFIRSLNKKAPAFPGMFDLCSGSGEPALSIFKKSNVFKKLVLSDKFPLAEFKGSSNIQYLQTKSDVLGLVYEPGWTYTMFNAFHHFSKEEKTQILNKIRTAGSEARFVEILQPGPLCFLKVFFACTAGVILLTPFIRPFSLKRLFFTYIIPLGLLSILTDGLISVFRSGSKAEYKKLIHDIPGARFSIGGYKLAPLYIIEINQG